jgi:hypothetical protein
VIEAKTLLPNYFFMSETLILVLSDLQNSISFSEGTMKLQGYQSVKQCFANNVFASITSTSTALIPFAEFPTPYPPH